MLNGAPFDVQYAVEVGLLDATLFEDELGDYLGNDGKPAAVVTWESAAARLIVPFRPRPERAIAVLTVAGMIVEGAGRRPPRCRSRRRRWPAAARSCRRCGRRPPTSEWRLSCWR